MKKLLLSLIICGSFFAEAQTAVNFNCNDCASNNHDLFTELNAGKVVVICWVMPCNVCISGATAAQNAVLSYSNSNPGQISYYMADDYANSSCATIQSWATTNSITIATLFSNAAVNMNGYGAAGMPKVIVVGGNSHTVFYNQNGGAITLAGIQGGISAALAATAVKENSADNYKAIISPNPASNEISLSYELKQSENVSIQIYNLIGEKVRSIENVSTTGKNEMKINVEGLSNGAYFLRINNGKKTDNVRFVISK